MSPPRPPREEDLPEVARLMSAGWPEPIDEETVRREWTAPGVDLDRDARLEPDAFGSTCGVLRRHPRPGSGARDWVRLLGGRRFCTRSRSSGRFDIYEKAAA